MMKYQQMKDLYKIFWPMATIISILLLVLSCSEEDEAPVEPPMAPTIEGLWEPIKYTFLSNLTGELETHYYSDTLQIRNPCAEFTGTEWIFTLDGQETLRFNYEIMINGIFGFPDFEQILLHQVIFQNDTLFLERLIEFKEDTWDYKEFCV